MDRGREVRWEKDAATVETMYALVTATLLGGAVLALLAAPALRWSLPPGAENAFRATGCVAGAVVALARVVTVLRRFDRQRRQGT
ncbi:hypothetical protein FM076_30570 [Streptomyces albus subsp. chlorinus]|uniref:DUF6332 family protein n=1 Tax=Streptomyces albus TaxID=1888 RepID=UPI001570298A|nr:DUF6332 family protein [Streptomyces albus]NSC25264.1 hypothetical protein [Streptomyces albus subsp. chlorinus]